MLEETDCRSVKRALRLRALTFAIVLGPACLPLAALPPAQASEPRFWRAGNYTFSDELGGFSIVGVTGSGTYNDPAVIIQDIHTVAKSVITIRRLPVTKGLHSFNSNWTTLHVNLLVNNQSPASWIGFRVELQEELGTPSIYGDGLSFNQITRNDESILSDRFTRFEVEHEPGDRLTFNDGWLDTLETARFNLFVLDLTPTPVFYLEQVPHLPAS